VNEAKFDGMGEIYAKFRPTYPKAFIEYLRSDVGFNKESTVADIGSGTGILTKQLLQITKNIFGQFLTVKVFCFHINNVCVSLFLLKQ